MKEETMENLIPTYRDAVFSQGGAIVASPGDKIFIRVLLDNRQEVSDQNFHVWVKAKLKSMNYTTVILHEVALIGTFENEQKQKVYEEGFDDLKNRFRGTKTKTLKKDGHWLIVLSGINS